MISIKDRFGASWPIFGGPFVSAAADHNWPNLYQASNPPGGRAKYLELYQRSNCRLKIVSFSQPQKKSWHYCFILKFKIDLDRHRNGLVSIRMWLVDVWPCAFCSKAVVATSIQLWRRVTNNLSTFYTFTLTRTRTWGRKLKSFDNIFILYHLPD